MHMLSIRNRGHDHTYLTYHKVADLFGVFHATYLMCPNLLNFPDFMDILNISGVSGYTAAAVPCVQDWGG